MTSLPISKNLPVGSKVDGGPDRKTDTVVISLAYIFPLGTKVGKNMTYVGLPT
jgi:hypothetical protein